MTDFTIFCGNTILLKVTVTDLDTDAPLDVTGTTIKFKAARKVGDTLPLIEKTVGSGITITDGPAGKFQVLLLPGDTIELLKGKLYYECDVLETSERLSTVIAGIITLTPTLLREADDPDAP